MPFDPQTHAALAAFRRGVEHLYGDRLEAIILFGSRARGDSRDDSDVDLAVVLKGQADDPLAEADRIMDAVFVPSMDAGRVIQPLVLSDREFARKESPVLRSVRAEGKPI